MCYVNVTFLIMFYLFSTDTVAVKVEHDVDEDVFQNQTYFEDVKECIESPIKNENSSSVFGEIKQDMTQVFVHTTRLDDMNILKRDLSKLTIRNIVNQMISESKPKNTLQHNVSFGSEQSYNVLVDKINQFNALAFRTSYTSTQTYLKPEDAPELQLSETSMKLYKLCTPVSIRLVDCKSMLTSKPSDNNTSNITAPSSKCLDEKIQILPHKEACIDMDVIIDEYKSLADPFNVGISSTVNPTIIYRVTDHPFVSYDTKIVVRNIYLNSSEIYYLHCKHTILSEYYYFDHVITPDEELLQCVQKDVPILKFFNCCWCKSEMNIKTVFPSKSIVNFSWFLRKPHNCQQKCKCCCRKLSDKLERCIAIVNYVKPNTQSVKKSTIKESKSYLDNLGMSRWQKILLETNKGNPQSCINQALKHSRLKEKKPVEITDNQCITEPFAFKVVVKNVVEHYISGNINKDEDDKSANMRTCCWAKRQLCSLEFPQYIGNLMREPHRCAVNKVKCNCCCSKVMLVLENKPLVSVPAVIQYCKNYNSRHIINWKNIDKREIPILDKLNAKQHHTLNQKGNDMQSPQLRKKKNNRPKTQKTYKKQISKPGIAPVLSPTALNQKVNDMQSPRLPINKTDQPKKTNTFKKQIPVQIPKSSILPVLSPTTTAVRPRAPIPNQFEAPAPVHPQTPTSIQSQTPLMNPQENTVTPQIPNFLSHNLNIPTNPNIQPLNQDGNNVYPGVTIEDPTVFALFNTLLQKFKDIRLTIDAKGQINANLNTPINTMSTDELKMLAQILSYAQQQVKLLSATRIHNVMISSMAGNQSTQPPSVNTPLVNMNRHKMRQ
jgi:hypothetical protein